MMFEIAAGGSEEFRRRPFAACYINIAKALMHNPESVEKLLFLASSLIQCAICDDIISWIKHYLPGLDVNAETLPLDLIEEIGTDGDYIQTDHTMKHFKEDEYPELRDRRNYADWMALGGMTMKDRAQKKVGEILDNHVPEVLDKSVEKKLKQIAENA